MNVDLDEAAYRDAGRRCLELCAARHAPHGEGIVLGLEEGFQIPLCGRTLLNGFIDRLMKRDDAYEVHDYKTSQRLPTLDQARAEAQARSSVDAFGRERGASASFFLLCLLSRQIAAHYTAGVGE